MIINSLLVGFGAAFGAYIRNFLTLISRKVKIDFPFMTMLINISGSFVLGYLTASVTDKKMLLFLGTGICGGFTTFGTFNMELSQLWFQRRFISCLIYFSLTYIFGILGFIIGIHI
ncbi:fluoride efflux transporter FluC [Companilactobacillus baiquanensis]|uniref:Fluoride-specific ion channel FluC n=1 Tax=Companilactobacillus baiquanensis TaxID=2486005 RepID=A0ABW1UW75_9LACO|nr:CrcB family protein [Companilactobacillus baiquanensis]